MPRFFALSPSCRDRFLLAALIVVPLSAPTGHADNWLFSYDATGNLTIRTAETSASPQILEDPKTQMVAPGELASFSVVMADTRALTYQWRFNGIPLSWTGASSDALLLANVQATNEGQYSVVVTSSMGSLTSAPAMLWIDSDRDGLPDSWELAYFGNLTSQRSGGDADGDGVPNLSEFFDGTNPTNSASGRPRLNVISDGGTVAFAPFKLSYDFGEMVTLTAAPDPPNSFHGWTGDTNTPGNPLALFMDTNKTLQAHFISAPPPAGMVGWWRAENTTLDAVGTNNGVLDNGTTFAPGKVGQAFSFNGANQSVSIPDTPALRPASLTIEGWVLFTAGDGTRVFFAKPVGAGIFDSFAVWLQNGNLLAVISDVSGSGPALSIPFSPVLDRWYHIAFTFDNTTRQQALYLNGARVALNFSDRAIGYDNHAVLLGRDDDSGSPSVPFAGSIDEATLYNRALTSIEVASIYLADVAGKETVTPYFISPSQLPDALVGSAYTQQLATVHGTLPISFTLSAGSLPLGLTLSTSGLLSGVPTTSGSNVFAVLATDATGVSTELVCNLYVAPMLVPVTPGGLVAWWRAENNALDFVGTHHGSLSNGATYAVGKVGQAFSFDGVDDYVVAPDTGLPSGNAPRTVEFWMKYEPGASGNHEAFIYGGLSVGSSFYTVIIGNRLYIGNIGGGDTPGSTLATDGNWHHVALIHDGSTTRMYVDGQLDALANRTYATVLSGSFYMGAIPGTGERFKGQVDELAVYDRALSQSELAGIYNAGSAGKKTSGPYINTPAVLTDAFTGQNYSQTFSTLFSTPPVSYLITTGALPLGLTLSSAGVLSGTPINAGDYTFTVRATDGTSAMTEQLFTLHVFAKIPPPGGLVGWWRAESNALDSVGTNNGVLRNGTPFAAGKVGQAFALDGGSQSIEIADAPALRPSSLTLEAWIFFNGSSGIRTIFEKPLGSGFLDSYGMSLNNGHLDAAIADSSGIGLVLSAPYPLTPGEWHHLAYTFDDGTKQQAMYIDGAQVASGLANKSIEYDNQPLLLGRDTENGSPAYFFPGRIDEAAIYNRALSAPEVASIYKAGPGGKTDSGPYFSTPPVLPDAVATQGYTQMLASARGTAPMTFAVTGGSLPGGLTLSSSGLLSGTATNPGNFNFAVRVRDAASLSAEQAFTLQVLPFILPPAGIVAWWRAENDALDSIGSNDGNLINGATFAAGKVGQSFSLDGVDDTIEIADTPALRPASITLEAWVMFFSVGGLQHVIAKTIGSGGADSYALWYDSGNLRGMICDITGANSLISAPFVPVLGQWYHVAFTFDDSTKLQWLYVDGIAIATGASNRTIGYDTHSVLLGADIENGFQSFVLYGRIDEAAIYNRALSANEIAALYSAGPVGKTTTGPYINTAPLLPGAGVTQAYTQTVTSVRGTAPVTYSLSGGTLPAGLTLNSSGTLGGTPTTAGLYNFVVRATDADGLFSDQSFTLQVSAPISPPAGLVSWWRAENNVLDALGANNGVVSNGTTFAAGKVGRSFSLDGINDFIRIPDSPSLRSPSITIEAWVNFSIATGVRIIAAKPLGSGTLDSFALWWDNGNLRAVMSDNSDNGPLLSYPFTPALGQWYHVAFTFDDATRQQVLYLDKVTVASGSGNRSIAYDSQPLVLGCDIDNGSRAWFFAGSIDEAAFYNRALTAAEIASIHNAGPAGKRFGSVPPVELRITAVERIGNDLRLGFTSMSSQTYALQSRSDLSSGIWTTLTGATQSGTGGTLQITLSNAVDQLQQFYRVQQLP